MTDWDSYARAGCSCGNCVWPVPPKSEKIYKKKVKCPNCGKEWLIKRWPGGRAQMKLLRIPKNGPLSN